jgi:ribonuclease HI
MHFPASNNATEYEALLHGLRIAMALGIHRLKVPRDSMLVINQANKVCSCLDHKMLRNKKTILMISSTYISCEERMRSRMS